MCVKGVKELSDISCRSGFIPALKDGAFFGTTVTVASVEDGPPFPGQGPCGSGT